VYRLGMMAMERMQERHMFFGTSLMVTRRNFGLVTSRTFVRDLMKRGSRLFFYVDYVPIEPGTEHLVPSQIQMNNEALSLALLRREYPALFLASSGMEHRFGGCMAAGKAFVHVSAEGDLEPCPFSPYSDTNLREVPMRDALRSRFLRQIRESDEHLSEHGGGCALWTRREWLQSLLGTAEMHETSLDRVAPTPLGADEALEIASDAWAA
jgi:MoaA/NifB/PqqE/SkfB family radical SAM enzyme